jgi:hypothetical protein
MVIGIGFITIVTAAVTSVFVEASRQRSVKTADQADYKAAADRDGDMATVNARLDDIEETLALLVEQTRPR